ARALAQRGEDADAGEVAGEQVADRDADPEGPGRLGAGDRHQARHALDDLVVARPVGVGPGLAEARDAGVDQPRVQGGQVLVVDAEPLLHAGPEVLDEDVGARNEPEQNVVAFRPREVEQDALLTSMEVDGVEWHAGAVHLARTLHTDHLGAEVGEETGTGRTGADLGEVEDADVREGHERLGGAWPPGVRRQSSSAGSPSLSSSSSSSSASSSSSSSSSSRSSSSKSSSSSSSS